jgi:hypothetical protein
MKEKNVSVMEEYFSRIYTVVPGLEIISLGLTHREQNQVQ